MTDTGASARDRRVSRRRFIATTGATGAAMVLAGCPYGSDRGTDWNTPTRTERSPGGTTGTPTDDGEGTVTWAFDPVAIRENGEAITQALYDNGLSDDVDVEFVPGDEDVDQQRADYDRILGEEDPSPDLFLMDYDWVNVFAQRDQLQDLSELLGEETTAAIEEEYFEGVTATARGRESGALFGVPVFVDLPTMQYRVDLVEAAGYSPRENDWATEPMTWEEWSHVTADVTDNADVEFGFTTQWDIYEGTACCTFNEVLSSWGGAYFGGRENLFGPVDDRPITVDSEPVLRSLNMMRKFVHDEDFDRLAGYAGGFAPTDILGWVENESREPFANGDAVMHRNWTDSLGLTGQNGDARAAPSLGENLGAMPMPYAVPENEARAQGTGGTTAALDCWHATVNPNSQDLAAVAEVLETVTRPGFQVELFSLQGWLPPRPALFDSREVRSVEGAERFLDTLRVAGENVMPHPATRVWNDEASVVAQQANRAVAQELPADRAMADLASSLREIERAA